MLLFFLKTAVFFILFSFPVKQGRSGPCFEKLNWSGLKKSWSLPKRRLSTRARTEPGTYQGLLTTRPSYKQALFWLKLIIPIKVRPTYLIDRSEFLGLLQAQYTLHPHPATRQNDRRSRWKTKTSKGLYQFYVPICMKPCCNLLCF